MKKTDIKTGAILEIPLEKEYGYGYIKLVFSKDINPNLIGILVIKVYNLFRKKRLSEAEFDSNFFTTDDLVIYPLLMIGFPIFRGKNKWILKGYAKLTEEDKVIPDYLKIELDKKFCKSTIKQETESENGCLLIRNFQNPPIQIRNFEIVKHIGQWIHYSPKGIRKLVSMFWMNKNGEAIREFYTNEEFNTNAWSKLIYDTIIYNNDCNFITGIGKRRLKAEIK